MRLLFLFNCLLLTLSLKAQCDPPVHIDPIPVLCSSSLSYQLTATPAGGTWSGIQVSADGVVNPSNLNGLYPLTYIYSDSTCTDTVNALYRVINGPSLSAGSDFSISCGGMPHLNGAFVPGPNNSAFWSTSDGHIVGAANDMNTQIDAPGTYILTAINSADGCPRQDTVIVYPSLATFPHTEITATICQGDTLLGYTTSGNFYTKFETGAACDSFRLVHLTVLPPLRDTLAVTTCAGTPVGGYTLTGIYTDTLVAQSGCDSIRVLMLTVLPGITTNIQLGTCDPNQIGTFTMVLSAINGCDSVVVTTVSLLPSEVKNISQTICAGASFEGYTQSGVYTDVFTAANGCDSIRVLQLTVLPGITTNIQLGTCDPNQIGTFTMVLSAINGCDSVVVTTVSLLPSEVKNISQTICAGASFGGYTQSGVYTDVFTAANGCDSIRILNLSVLPVPVANADIHPDNGTGNGSIMVTAVGGNPPYFFLWNTGDTTASIDGLSAGDYQLTLSDGSGCSAVYSFNVSMSVATNSPQQGTFKLLAIPNPVQAGEKLQLNLDALLEGTCLVSVFNTAGQLVQEFVHAQAEAINQLSMTLDTSGFYIVRVLDGVGHHAFLRLVVQ